jgi:hypothetical protein
MLRANMINGGEICSQALMYECLQRFLDTVGGTHSIFLQNQHNINELTQLNQQPVNDNQQLTDQNLQLENQNQ